MSETTPRPWEVEDNGPTCLMFIKQAGAPKVVMESEGIPDGAIATIESPEFRERGDAELIVRAVNAFAALLAVAKAADQADPTRALANMVTWSHALKDLDAAHPGWREFTV